MSGHERRYIDEAFATNWIAPTGPQVDAFEREFAAAVGASYATALTSGTAALHLALRLTGVCPSDEVFVSTFTFVASVNPILYQGATPRFIDSDRESWNMDPQLLADALAEAASRGKLPKAVVAVHLYGQSADLDPIVATCERYGVSLIEDAAESLGATYRGRAPGTFGRAGIFSFNGNKVITTSGGGMLVSEDGTLIDRARKLATQAREPATHYEHLEVGYNYRLSNVLAAIGRGQLQVLDERVEARRRNFAFYCNSLQNLPGIEFMPEAPRSRHARWLTCLTIDPKEFGVDRDTVCVAFEKAGIEARPVWKPMHLQPLFAAYPYEGGTVAADIFANGICLPSGSNLRTADLENVVEIIHSLHRRAR
jgi:pyridoxal phosphate-dependent aminotransferase EpsN